MAAKGLSEMVSSVWRIKWWKYRYVVIAAVVVNLFLINQFFFDQSFINLNPFRSSPQSDPSIHQDVPVQPEIKPDPNPAPTSLQAPPAPAQEPASISATPTPSTSTLSVPSTASAQPSAPVSPLATIPSSGSAHIFNLHDYSFDGEYVGWPLQRLCNETVFQPGLAFVCDNNSGGIGNIRNFILTCIRYAIDAGASELIMPRIQQRSDQDLANIFTGGFHPFDYFFDKDHFKQALGTNCPQMRIRETLDDVPNAGKMLTITEFYPKDLNVDLDGCDGRGVNRHLDMFRPEFYGWLKNSKHLPTAAEPISIRFKWATFFEWPIYRDGPELATTFGDILRIRKDIQELAAITLGEMEKFAGVTPQPPKLQAPYLGVHLRTESDALGFWPSFDEQSNGYLAQAEPKGLKHAYLACGDSNEAKRFSDKAANVTGMLVATKLDLLKGDDLKRLTDLSWDQQALVDFLVLTKSAHFTGCSFSSFAMNVAFKRHLMTRGISSLQWKSPGDLYSTLIGRFRSWYGDWMFMYECMWP